MIYASTGNNYDDGTVEDLKRYSSGSIQLSLFHYDSYEKTKKQLLEYIIKNDIEVRVCHLPFETLKIDFQLIFKMMQEVYFNTQCKKFVIHPNRNINKFIENFLKVQTLDMTLSVETFGWKNNKFYRSPLDIVEACKDYDSKRIKMTIDTSHIEKMWFQLPIMKFLLKYTNVIHLSNTRDNEKHLPFNIGNGDMNLVSFVKELIKYYHWEGDIVLEYMPEYNNKLVPNVQYLRKILENRQ